MLKKIKKYIQRFLPWLALFGLVFLRAYNPPFLEVLRYKSFDAYQQYLPKENVADLPVYVIDVDDESLDVIGQWPWSRKVIADMVEILFNRYGVAAVAFDMVFAEPDRTSLENIVQYYPSLAAEDIIKNQESNDDYFARLIQHKPVILGQTFKAEASVNEAALKRTMRFIEKRPKEMVLDAEVAHQFRHTGSVVRNLEVLENTAEGIGHFNILPDVDAVVRRVPALLSYQGALYPTLSLEVLRLLQGAKTPTYLKYGPDGTLASIASGQFEVVTDEEGFVWPRFRKVNKEKYISAQKVLARESLGNKLEGAVVFVGTSAPGLFDLRSTPLDPIVPGVEVHVQLLESFLTGESLYRPLYADVIEQFFTICTATLLILLLSFVGARLSLVALVGCVAGAFYTSIMLYVQQSILIDALYPVVSLIVIFIITVALKYMREESQRRAIRHAFAHYLSPDLVQMLGQEKATLSLGGEEKEMTVMFTDIRSFTTISESLSPERLTLLLNKYLTPMTAIVQKNEGTIDKYIGDALMAFWNAPLDIDAHQQKACLSAQQMLTELDVLNKAFLTEGLPTLSIGIGIHTAVVRVGNMGSKQRLNYTVMGDGVNLASRLEGLCKQYGVEIIASEETVQHLEGFCFAPLDNVVVKGKSESVRIFALLRSEQEKSAIKMTRAFNAYQKGNLADAKLLYGSLIGFDVLKALYLKRIQELEEKGLPADWNGVYLWQEK